MAIPEEQLNTWAQIGAQTTSKQTYATVKLALAGDEAGYNGKDYSIFLQGSYGNDTNIYKESDVDVVIRLDSVFTYDLRDSHQVKQRPSRLLTAPRPTPISTFSRVYSGCSKNALRPMSRRAPRP